MLPPDHAVLQRQSCSVSAAPCAPRGIIAPTACRNPIAVWTLILALHVLPAVPSRSDDRIDYRYEFYGEEHGRIEVQTHSAYGEKAINPNLTLKAEYVHDAISGATPTGAPPPPGSKQVPTTHMDDDRNAGYVELDWHIGTHTLSPQFAYSTESDYDSIGISLTDAVEFNQKNTTLIVGLAHAFDSIEPSFWSDPKHKNTTDALIGVNQLLTPKTVFTANVTFGYSSGYLADPYKGVQFTGYPDPNSVFPEQRPDHKYKEIVLLGLTQFFDPLNASAELSYRFYYDSFHIMANTVTLTWFQKLGKYLILAPTFRFYDQTQAFFYCVSRPGDPSDPASTVKIPSYYSADYRLSAMQSFTYGIQATGKIRDWLFVDAAYTRYDMRGTDGKTAATAYPDANVFSAGVRLWF